MYRHHRLLEALPRTNYVFLMDADMLAVGPIGPEIIPSEYGITACQHPGYVGKPRAELPYETLPESAAYVGPEEGDVYYCGGFVGGERLAMRMLSSQIAAIVDMDVSRGHTPVWHDESALNRVLAVDPPAVALSPAYCYPSEDSYYRECVWTESYERRILALDKTAEERGER